MKLDKARGRGASVALSLSALGVVFGDIGTSPLYALKACFSEVGDVAIGVSSVLGVLSLIFWSLALIISLKYVSIVLRADNRGEGGVLALTTLVLEQGPRVQQGAVAALGLVGCALFFGDGSITPAISVLSAVEGLEVVAPALSRVVLPLALLCLLVLFKVQWRGTSHIGRMFGPVMLVWFVVLAVLGGISVAGNPQVLAALNPGYAVGFFVQHSGVALAVFGAVFLSVTGGEALYADLGHFGRTPIASAWFFVAWPALLLNYFGQGALLLRDPAALRNPFYLLAPDWAQLLLVILATCATIIASQAVISGVFSIAQQCKQLGYLPRLRVVQSSADAVGQVYVPSINWLLCAVTVGLVLTFGSSTNLASAYGVGVSMTMLIDSVLMLLLLSVAASRAARLQFVALIGVAVIETGFVLGNLGKIPSGGWFPLLYGLAVYGLMRTWQDGRATVSRQLAAEERPVQRFLADVAIQAPARVPLTAVFLGSNPDTIPRTLVRNVRLNGVLHERTILLTITTERVPHVMRGGRLKVNTLAPGLFRVHAHVGFMERADVPRLLRDAQVLGLECRTEDAVFFLGRDDIVPTSPRGMGQLRKKLFVFLANNSEFAGAHFGIPANRIIELGGQIEI